MKLIRKFITWINQPEPSLGCPDPRMHDQNNENFDVVVTALTQLR